MGHENSHVEPMATMIWIGYIGSKLYSPFWNWVNEFL